MSYITQAFTSNTSYIAPLLEGFSWTGTTGQPATIRYSFDVSVEGGNLLNATERSAALSAMQLMSNVARVTFTQGTVFDAVLTFSNAELGNGVAGLTSTFFFGDTISTSEVQVDDDETDFSIGGFGFLTFLHEIGHALGLKHPGNYSGSETPPFLPSAEDSTDFTIMSYNDGSFTDAFSRNPRTPMIYDIAALQFIYGANTAYNSGNTTYSLTGTSEALTIWDGGGTDTIDANALSTGVTIDLREGISNVTQAGDSVWWIAFNANIENAAGGSGNDTITGNALNNQLFGRGANDTLDGGDGSDVLYGGAGVADTTDGNDQLAGGLGSDTVYGNSGNDIIYGGRASADTEDLADQLFGGKGADQIYGNTGNDTIFGGGSGADPLDTNDSIYGGKGADLIYGNGGNDTIFGGGSGFDPSESGDNILGGAGNDQIYGNGGNDTILGGAGNDSLHGGADNDIYVFASNEGVDTIQSFQNPGASAGDIIQLASNINGSGITSSTAVLSHITYSSGNAFIDLGGGNGINILDIAANSLDASDFLVT